MEEVVKVEDEGHLVQTGTNPSYLGEFCKFVTGCCGRDARTMCHPNGK